MAGKKIQVADNMDDFAFDPAVSAAKMPKDITGGMKARKDFVDIPTNKIRPYMGKRDSDFHRPSQEEMDAMLASFRVDQQLEAVIVRHYADDQYEIIAGETRWEVNQYGNIPYTLCRIINCDDATARRIFSATNLLRRTNTVSDLVVGWWHYYEGYLEAMEQARQINDFSKVPDLEKSSLRLRQIQKYHKMHNLPKPMLKALDKGTLTVEAGYLLAFLTSAELLDLCNWSLTPSKGQAERLKQLSADQKWSKENVMQIFTVQPTTTVDPNREISNAMRRFRRIVKASVKPEALPRLSDIFATAMKLYFEQHPEDKMATTGAREEGADQ